MADLFADAMGWLSDQLQAHASVAVTYGRGTRSVALSATRGKSLLRLSDGGAGRIEWTDQDFLFPAADLVLGGEPTEPRRGDTIRLADGTSALVYEVQAPAGEPPWRWSDAQRTTLRVHAKYIRTE